MKPWTLAQVNEACRSAPAVYLALCELADQRHSVVVTPTRDELVTMTGITINIVSAALTTLDKAGWIERQQVRRRDGGGWASMLRVTLRRYRKPVATAHKKTHRRRYRKPVATAESAVDTGNRLSVVSAVDTGNRYQTSLTEKGGVAAAPSLRGGDGTPQLQEHPAVRIERERMAEIRARRKSGQVPISQGDNQ